MVDVRIPSTLNSGINRVTARVICGNKGNVKSSAGVHDVVQEVKRNAFIEFVDKLIER